MFRLTPVVKNLLIINVIVFAAQNLLTGLDVTGMFSLWRIGSYKFAPYQYFTYMFAHGDLWHILFNMLGLVFLGPMLEQTWGSKRFLTFYLVTGIGAGMLFGVVEYAKTSSLKNEVNQYVSNPSPSAFNIYLGENLKGATDDYKEFAYNLLDSYDTNPDDIRIENRTKLEVEKIFEAIVNSSKMLGASGAIYGILMAFGLMFPDRELMLLFPPIPVKAKYLVFALGAYAIFAGFQRESGGVAHFAHLGGMVFAFIMIKYWQKTGNLY